VSVTWLDRAAVLKALRREVQALARVRPEIERVLLFGSLATGSAVPGSDADLLIVLRRADRPFLERIPHYTPENCPIGVDVFPYTRDEIERMLASGNSFLRAALDEGVALPLKR
jgi:predicted nucleotidyltransferase